jgi:hypothetical protein
MLTVTDRRQTRPLVKKGAPQRQHSNFQTENNIWSQVQSERDTKTYRLTDRQS